MDDVLSAKYEEAREEDRLRNQREDFSDMVAEGILTTLSQSIKGYKYDYGTVPFLAEVFKVSLFSAPIQGYMLGILSACLSALAGVYTEFLMKKNNDSLYWQNVQLYTFGALFNMARLVVDDFRSGFEKGPWWYRLFDGYSLTTWLVVLNLGSSGLLVSWLMKFADNIVKVYSSSMAMLLTMILSIYLFNFKPTVQLFLGIVICMMSVHIYFAPPTAFIQQLSLTENPERENLK